MAQDRGIVGRRAQALREALKKKVGHPYISGQKLMETTVKVEGAHQRQAPHRPRQPPGV